MSSLYVCVLYLSYDDDDSVCSFCGEWMMILGVNILIFPVQMENTEKGKGVLNDEIIKIYSDFMTRCPIIINSVFSIFMYKS